MMFDCNAVPPNDGNAIVRCGIAADQTGWGTMKMRKKADLPVKQCARCGLPFTWRKKWARDWDQVRYCSERCRRGGAAHAADSH